ncbi:MAG TPA: hypothetical protein VMD79_07360 [Solirubrobacteraceae bacterium]|nr:hypothetical protein [Solirubrobacteraceae bacterium]
MLAYVFWHRPRVDVERAGYERAQLAFHRSLSHSRPQGMRCSAMFKLDETPWPVHADAAGEAADVAVDDFYEDWYVLEDFTALGVLNEAAVGHGHRSAHDDAARRFGAGAGALYALIEGGRSEGEPLAPLGEANVAIWVARPIGAQRRALEDLLGDGMDPRHASLWRRQLVLGPAPEFCLLLHEQSVSDQPAGVAHTRLPAGWSATVIRRQALWHG